VAGEERSVTVGKVVIDLVSGHDVLVIAKREAVRLG
jgi:hypothetical protein